MQRYLIALISLLAIFSSYAQVCERYQEAPELAARVQTGTLPPVAERLPMQPRVVEPAEQIGVYGGEMYDLYDGNRLAEFREYGYENLVRWSVDGSEVIPNIAESWEVSKDATRYTFKLREGLKWSDGHPFTTADISFFWHDVATNEEISPGGARSYFYVDGQLPTLKVIDDLTFSFRWEQPHGLFLQGLSTSYGVYVTQYPRHYLEQFHMDYNPEGVAEMMENDGEDNFGQWWAAHIGGYGQAAEYNSPARPSMQPWIPSAPYIGEERFTFVRNPYYFKVDPACNQLPYIDARVFTLATDPEVRLLKTLSGEDSLSGRDISQPNNKAVFFDNQERGDYRFIDVINSDFNTMLLHIKFNHPETMQADIMQDKNFRIGLSQAMNRQNIIDTVYIGQGIPHQQAPHPNSPFYSERLATQYTEHNLDAANAALDLVLPERDADGFRLAPNGEPFVFSVLVNEGFRPDWVDIMQLVKRDWEEAGVRTQLVVVADDVWRARAEDTDVDAYVWAGENGTGQLPLLSAGVYLPEAADGWAAWEAVAIKGADAADLNAEVVVPPAAIQRQYEILAEIPKASGSEAQAALMDELLTLAADSFLTMGLSLPQGDYRVVSNRLRNVPNPVISGWFYPGPSPANFETFYIDETAGN